LVLALRPVALGHANNCSIDLSRIRQEQGIAPGVEQNHVQRCRVAELAGRILETPGAARHLKRLGEVAEPVSIYANGSPP
jgi:hypothetical protein